MLYFSIQRPNLKDQPKKSHSTKFHLNSSCNVAMVTTSFKSYPSMAP